MTRWSRHEIERSATIRLGGEEFEITYLAIGKCYYDPGKLSGPPEDCYPPESEGELTSLKLLDVRDSRSRPVVNEMVRALLTSQLKDLPIEEYLLEDWMQGGAYDGPPED